MQVAEFVQTSRRQPFRWGVVDCGMWPGDFVLAATGRDPVADLRGTYDTAFGARRVVMAAGGLRNLWRRRLAWLPEGRTVVLARRRGQMIGGLCEGDWFFARTETDVLMTREFEVVQGWGI